MKKTPDHCTNGKEQIFIKWRKKVLDLGLERLLGIVTIASVKLLLGFCSRERDCILVKGKRKENYRKHNDVGYLVIHT